VEDDNLFHAAINDGFFYLSLEDESYSGMLNTVDQVFRLSQKVFDLDEQTKMLFDLDKLSRMKIHG
jgi:isopenicillin N synthase-like dioxygenase